MISRSVSPGFLLGVPDDHEAVEPEPRAFGAANLGGVAPQLGELVPDAVEVLAVGEVPVGQLPAVAPRGGRIAALEDLRVRAPRPGQRLGLEAEVADPVEVTGQVRLVLRPDQLERGDELGGAPVALVVLEPRLAKLAELVGEPARDDVDRHPSPGQVVRGRDPLGQHARVPQAGMHGRDQLDPLGRQQQRQAEARRFVLVLGTVAGGVAYLAQRVVEPGPLGQPGQLAVVRERPVGALLDRAGDEAAADVGHPVGEPQWLGGRVGGHGTTSSSWSGFGGASSPRRRSTGMTPSPT